MKPKNTYQGIISTEGKIQIIPINPKPILLIELPHHVPKENVIKIARSLKRQIRDYHVICIDGAEKTTVRILSLKKINEIELKELEIKLDNYADNQPRKTKAAR